MSEWILHFFSFRKTPASHKNSPDSEMLFSIWTGTIIYSRRQNWMLKYVPLNKGMTSLLLHYLSVPSHLSCPSLGSSSRHFALWLSGEGGGLWLTPRPRTLLPLPFLPFRSRIRRIFRRVRRGLELDLFGGIFRLGHWFSSVPPQHEDDSDEEEIRASAETSDETQKDDPGGKEQREKERYLDHLGFGLEWSYLYLLDS